MYANTRTIGTVTDQAEDVTRGRCVTGVQTCALPILAGGLIIGDAVGPLGDDDIALGAGNLTLNVVGAVTQTANNVITAAGLQLLGTGTVTLNESGNNVATLAANYNGTIAYTDANALTIGTVTDGPSAMTTSGITTSGGDVKLTVLAGGLGLGDAVGPMGFAYTTLFRSNLTLNVVGAVTQTANNVITAA